MWIVEPFDVVEHSRPGFRPSLIFLSVQLLRFHAAIEALHDGIVVTLAAPAQTALDTQVGKQSLE